MNPVPESNSRDADKLLDAVLADDEWHALQCAVREQGLLALEARRRRRRWRIGLSQAACAAIVVLAAVSAWHSNRLPHPPGIQVASTAPVTSASFISEEEMLAMFPKGSCIVAEVDGQRQLVFLEPAQAQAGF